MLPNALLARGQGDEEVAGYGLSLPDELLRRYPNVLDNPPKEGRRDVPTSMNGHRGTATIPVLELLVGPPLPNLFESKCPENGDHLPRAEDGKAPHDCAETV